MKQRFILSLLALTLHLGAWADIYQDPVTKVNYEYTLGSGEARVAPGFAYTSGSPDAKGDVAILSNFSVDGNDYSVTSIGSRAFVRNDLLLSVTIPNSITSIREASFEGCNSLTTIAIPNSVTSIGERAFVDCWSLSSVSIPNSVTSIGDLAFMGCSSLISIVVENGNTIYDSRDNCNAVIRTEDNEFKFRK